MNAEKLKEIFQKLNYSIDGFLDKLPFPNTLEKIILGMLVFSIISYWTSLIISSFRSRTGSGRAIKRIQSGGVGNLKKEARKLQRAGKLVEAADIWGRLGKQDKAMTLYMKARDFGRAGKLYVHMGRTKEAISMYEKGNLYAQAGAIYEKEKQFKPAAISYQKAGRHIDAADLFKRVQDYKSAGDCYQQARMFGKAGEAFLNAGENMKAAKAFEAEFRSQAGRLKGHIDGDQAAAIRNNAKHAGGIYRKAGKLEEAARLYTEGNFKQEAAEVFEELGEHEKAAKLFEESGRREDAARMYDKSGQADSAAYLKAEAEKAKGNLKDAARYYEQADRQDLAADIYAELGMDQKAANLYLKSKDYSIAADMYLKLGKQKEAAEAYEAGSSYEKAAGLYEKLGDMAGAARVLLKKGMKVEAAQKFLAVGDYRSASKAIQEIDESDADFKKSFLVAAAIARQAGQPDQAIGLLQKGLMGENISDGNVQSFYMLGRLFEERGMPTPAQEIYKRILVTHYNYGDTAARLKALERPATAATVAPSQSGAGDATMITSGGANARSKRYELLEEIGRGGMGVVYKAKDTVLDRDVAMKVLPPDLKHYPKVVESFSREAKALAALKHSNIITVYDAGEENGEYYFVMEYVDGMDLKDFIVKRGMLPLKNALRIIWDVCQALNYAHGKNIIHRDIKTSNVMLGRDKRIMLMDFGLAKVMDEAKAARTAISGTPFYMSPEQTIGEGVDHRSDLYSLGIMAYELFTGTVPFKTGDIQYHHMHTQPKTLREVKPDLPQEIEDIVMKLIQKDKEKRYQSAAELLEDLKKIKL